MSSSSPGLAKVSFYGVYLDNLAQVRIFPYDCANQFNTMDVLKQLREEFPARPMKVIWDGAFYHRAKMVHIAAEVFDIILEPLPLYSPDFMPVEHLWQWLREEVTYRTCYDSKADLKAQVARFQHRINATPLAIADRLWVKLTWIQKKKNYGSQNRLGLSLSPGLPRIYYYRDLLDQ
ncbi:MAG: transposase [Cyanobacteria bacterium J06639_14]